jgi:hypothetical protein
MKIRDDGHRIKAMLRHLGCGRDVRDFPASANEKVALIRTADTRGLIAWRKTRARYELTSIGWNELMPRRRFGMPSLIISAATGGVAGVIAVAVFWPPADASRARANSSAPISRLEQPHVLQTARSAEICVPRYAPSPVMGVVEDAVAATEPEREPEIDRPVVTERPALDQPGTTSGASGAKEAGAKKSRKTAHHRRREQRRSWAYADPWRSRSIRYAGYGQRDWYGY